jgi:membrane-bound metal-dependent hydrolase YbcI (DUF457 family)
VDGGTHAATGAIAGLGLALLTGASLRHTMPVEEQAARDVLFAALTAGFALLPDADHPKASFAYSAGGLSHGLSHILARLFGGHRGGMHSVFGIALFALLSEAAAVWAPNRWALGILAAVMAMCIIAGLVATGFARHSSGTLVLGCAIAGVSVALPAVRADIWLLVAVGMAVHVLEDEFTGHGCALLWPVSFRRIGGDGRQPAGARQGRTRKPPVSEFKRQRRASQRRPAAPKPPLVPPVRTTRARGPLVMCPECWVDECERCKGQGCKCPQPAAAHPNRVKRKASTVQGDVTPRVWFPDPEDDKPPF